jgi:SHS2 domain-containing protein
MSLDITETQNYTRVFNEEKYVSKTSQIGYEAQRYCHGSRQTTAQRRMVEEQLKGRGITDTAVLAAMNTVPREHIEYARQRLDQLGYDNVWVRHGDGTLGWPEYVPYDAIIVSAGGPFVPPSLLQQLAINGRLVMPVGQHTRFQVLVRYTKDETEALRAQSLEPVAFVPLIGSEGWREEKCRYEELAHTADIGIRVRARSPAALFACAAEAMFKLTGAIIDEESIATPHFVAVESVDAESLLVDWLNELLYQHETTGEIYTHYRITAWEPTRLEAIIHGSRLVEPPVIHIKAVTFHQLQLTEEEDGWMAEIFFDI